MNSRVIEPLLVSAPLASFAELLANYTVLLQDEPQSAHFVDWSTNHTAGADAFYFSFQDNAYNKQIISEPLPEDATPMPATSSSIEGFCAITKNATKSFPPALRDSTWGGPAHLEFDINLTSTKSLVFMDTDIARPHNIQQGAEVLYMIPV